MDIQLKINKSDRRAINKVTQAITTKTNARLLDNCSLISPQFVLENSAANLTANYIYVPSFKRFYFVDNITILNNSQLRFECSVDVLESFKSEILASTQIVKRNTNKFNLYLDDPLFQTSVKVQNIVKKFSGSEFTVNNLNSEPCFVLTVVGG